MTAVAGAGQPARTDRKLVVPVHVAAELEQRVPQGQLGLAIVGEIRQPSFVDFDGDGDLDLFVAVRDAPNVLYRNDGARFVDVSRQSGIDDARQLVAQCQDRRQRILVHDDFDAAFLDGKRQADLQVAA